MAYHSLSARLCDVTVADFLLNILSNLRVKAEDVLPRDREQRLPQARIIMKNGYDV